jgi:sugar-specific transcriptional regulator TrmB
LSAIVDFFLILIQNSIMDAQLISNIEDLGLSNKEARVYVASLMLGPSGVQAVADFSGIKRVTTYVILESLVTLGLVSQSIKGKKTLFIAEDPANLKRLLEKKEQEVKDQKHNLETILPDLIGLKALPKESTSVRFYEGAEGIKGLFATFYSTYNGKIETVYGISNIDQLHSFFPELAAISAHPGRVEHNLRSKFLYTSERGAIYQESDKATGRISRFVPMNKYPISGDISIIGDYVIILSLIGQHPLGITINSSEIAKSMRVFFDMIWDAAEKFN